jgi:hypothetical protein
MSCGRMATPTKKKNRLALVLDGLTQEMLDYEIKVIREFVMLRSR